MPVPRHEHRLRARDEAARPANYRRKLSLKCDRQQQLVDLVPIEPIDPCRRNIDVVKIEAGPEIAVYEVVARIVQRSSLRSIPRKSSRA